MSCASYHTNNNNMGDATSKQVLENRIMYLEQMMTNMVNNNTNNNGQSGSLGNNSQQQFSRPPPPPPPLASSSGNGGISMQTIGSRYQVSDVQPPYHHHQMSSSGGSFDASLPSSYQQQYSHHHPSQPQHQHQANASSSSHAFAPFGSANGGVGVAGVGVGGSSSSGVSAAASQYALKRIADLESTNAALMDQLKQKSDLAHSLKIKNEELTSDVTSLQNRLSATIATNKLNEAAANANAILAKKSVEEAEKTAAVWGTIQTLRSAFARQGAQAALFSTILNNNSNKHQQQQHFASSTTVKNSVVKKEAEVEGEASVSNFVSSYQRGLAGGQKRERDDNNRDDVVVSVGLQPPRGAVSLNRPSRTTTTYYDDEDDGEQQYRGGGGGRNNNNPSQTPNGKTATKTKTGRTPRTPSVTGAEKIHQQPKKRVTAVNINYLGHYNNNAAAIRGEENEEGYGITGAATSVSVGRGGEGGGGGGASSSVATYRGPKGVSEMSSLGTPSVARGGGGGGAAQSFYPPFSPAPKPTAKAGGVGGGGVKANKPQQEDLSPVFDAALKPYHQQREEAEEGSAAAAASRSHTKMTSIRKQYRNGGGLGSAFVTRSPTPANPTRGPDVDRRFILSGISEEDRKNIMYAVSQLGQRALVVDSGVDQPPPPNCTHVVIPGMPQSFKALCGLVSCRWLITPQYIFDSLAAGFWLNEADSNHVRCHPPPLAHQQFVVALPPPPPHLAASPAAMNDLQAMRNRLEFVIRYGDGVLVKDAPAGSGVVVITSGDDIFNYCLKPQV